MGALCSIITAHAAKTNKVGFTDAVDSTITRAHPHDVSTRRIYSAKAST
ncbi:hypothetical protein [Brevibacterium sp. RIT 803]|nr:hypothetical protein [Brevibacterium sp. RIT 803]MBM6588876.1 hypothetical protein [Brevibacterium sp. RIT 803]